MSRSRSSGTGPPSEPSPFPPESTATSPSSSRPRVSRRRRSIARLRAVVVIQPPGFGGRPSSGHLRSATVKASCTASSATSMSPKTRMSDATDRPDSSRKIRPTSASSTPCTASGLGHVAERADLDRLRDACGGLRRPGERSVEVRGLDDVEAAEVLLRLREGTVGGQHLTAGRAHDRGSVGFAQRAAEDPGAGRLQLLLEGADPLHELPHLVVAHRGLSLALDAVDGQQVLRHGDPLCPGGRVPPLTHYERASPRLTGG